MPNLASLLPCRTLLAPFVTTKCDDAHPTVIAGKGCIYETLQDASTLNEAK